MIFFGGITVFSLVIILISIASVLLTYRLLKSNARKDDITSIAMRVMVITFAALGLFRFFLSDAFVELAIKPLYAPHQSIVRWLYYTGYAILPISVFSDSRLFRNLSTVVTLPAAFFSALLFDDTMQYFLSPQGNGFDLNVPTRYVLYALELALALTIPLMTIILRGHRVNLRSKREIASVALAIPATLIVMTPAYIPQSLLGYTDISYSAFSTMHLGWMAYMIILAAVIILYFKRRPMEDRHLMLVFMTIAQLFNSMSAMLRGFYISRLPLQLCSIAAFFYLATMLTRSKKLFHFCFIVNLIGGVIAVVLAFFDVGALQFWNVHYMHEHTFVMVIPITALALGVFPRIEWHYIPSALKIFSIYFISCLVAGTFINGYYDVIGQIVGIKPLNFFYMLSPEVAVSYLPFATFVGLIEWKIGKFVIYPLLVSVVYVAFVALCLLFFLAMRLGYKIKDKLSKKNEKEAESSSVCV